MIKPIIKQSTLHDGLGAVFSHPEIFVILRWSYPQWGGAKGRWNGHSI